MAPSSIPPPLPPTVEEAYRRKCIQLKQRTKEVENANDAARLRLERMRRQVEKMRLERAFLLEQLARRTSTNVEDSEGSPSPPPTPKEKPLRIKRGHRKGSLLANIETPPPPSAAGPSSSAAAHGGPSNLLASQNLRGTLSPSSDAFSHSHADLTQKSGGGANGKMAKKGPTPFDMYYRAAAAELLAEKDSAELYGEEVDPRARTQAVMDEHIEHTWQKLTAAQRAKYEAKADAARADLENKGKEDKEENRGSERSSSGAKHGGLADDGVKDEDVEMGNYDSSDQETQGEKQDE